MVLYLNVLPIALFARLLGYITMYHSRKGFKSDFLSDLEFFMNARAKAIV